MALCAHLQCFCEFNCFKREHMKANRVEKDRVYIYIVLEELNSIYMR